MTTAAMEPGAAYDWPEHLPMPEGYPPWNANPIVWRRENTPGGWPMPNPEEYGVPVTPQQKTALLYLAARFDLTPAQFVELLQEIRIDTSRKFALKHNITRAFSAEREFAYRGMEMETGLVAKLRGPAGSGKTNLAVLLAYRDLIAAHRAGYMRRHGFTPSDPEWRLGVRNLCCDTIEYNENRSLQRDHTCQILDDPRKPIGSEEGELFKVAVASTSDKGTKMRSCGMRFIFTDVYDVQFNPLLFTHDFWNQIGWRIRGLCGFSILSTRRSGDNYQWSGYYVAPQAELEVGPPFADAPGPVLMAEFRRIKLEAHKKLYGGTTIPKFATFADEVLSSRPGEVADNIITKEQIFDWLSPVLDDAYGLTVNAVDRVRLQIWGAMGRAHYYPVRPCKETGMHPGIRCRDEGVIHVQGDPVGLRQMQMVWDIREKLPLPRDRLEPRPVRIQHGARRVA